MRLEEKKKTRLPGSVSHKKVAWRRLWRIIQPNCLCQRKAGYFCGIPDRQLSNFFHKNCSSRSSAASPGSLWLLPSLLEMFNPSIQLEIITTVLLRGSYVPLGQNREEHLETGEDWEMRDLHLGWAVKEEGALRTAAQGRLFLRWEWVGQGQHPPQN